MWTRGAALLSASGAMAGAALYSAHRELTPLTRFDAPLAALPLAALSGVAEALQAAPLPPAALAAYARAVGGGEEERQAHRTVRSYRLRAPPPPVNAASGADICTVLAPLGGVVEAAGAVGARGALLDTDVRTLLDADAGDPLCLSAVDVGGGGRVQAAKATLRYVALRPAAGDSLALVAPADAEVRRRVVAGCLASRRPAAAERTLYVGSWAQGLLAVVALGGSGRRARVRGSDDDEELRLVRGEAVGNDALVERVVLLYEAADDGFKLLVKEGDVVGRGQVLATVSTKAVDSKKTEEGGKVRSAQRGTRARARRTW